MKMKIIRESQGTKSKQRENNKLKTKKERYGDKRGRIIFEVLQIRDNEKETKKKRETKN